MPQVMDLNGDQTKKEESKPSWAYATKKTAAKGVLNTALLISNAAQVKALFGISDSDRDGFWYTQLVLLFLSIAMQIVADALLLVLGYKQPKVPEEKAQCERMNDAALILVLLISLINIVISAFGIEISGNS